MLETVMGYLRSVLLHTPFAESLRATPRWTTRYDVDQWRRDGYQNGLETYALRDPLTYTATVEPRRRALIESRIATFGEHPS
jgi:hypothetical protein